MLLRIGAIAMNTYREAVRARILHGLLGLTLLTLGYALVLGAYALQEQARVVSNVGAAAISIFGLLVAVMISASSLYREVELKTIFPILGRPLHRWEFIVGKYCGILLTLWVFLAFSAGILLSAEGVVGGRAMSIGMAVPLTLGAVGVVFALKRPAVGTWLPVPLSGALLAFGYFFASVAPDERAVIIGQTFLSSLELMIVAAIALVFASFSSPFLSGIFTLSFVIIGRSADSLAQLPEHMFGPLIKDLGALVAKMVPNLMVYIGPRELFTGETELSLSGYLINSSVQATCWAFLLLLTAALAFRKRDFL